MKNLHSSSNQTHYHSKRTTAGRTVCAIALISFWFGLFLMITGSVISFVPGAECGWFTVAGIFVLPGLLIPKKGFQIAAIIFCAFSLFWAYAGYVRGVNYHEGLQDRNAVSQLTQGSLQQFHKPRKNVTNTMVDDNISMCIVRRGVAVDDD